ncbi:MAG: hypothetical protein HQK53_17820 [Oligoflexia bacterium]|nr:hypothetical protein [Oligoflexia bacterium]
MRPPSVLLLAAIIFVSTLLVIQSQTANAGAICSKLYPPEYVLVKVPIKVVYKVIVKIPVEIAYWVVVKKPVHIIERGFRKIKHDIKKKPWKIISGWMIVPFEHVKIVYEEVKEKRFKTEFREEVTEKIETVFKEIKELKQSAKFFECVAKEKDIISLLRVYTWGGSKLSELIYNQVTSDTVTDKSQIGYENINDHAEERSFISNGLVYTYQIIYTGRNYVELTQRKEDKEVLIQSDECTHEIVQEIEATAPCLVDVRPVSDLTISTPPPFSCEKTFVTKKTISRGKEYGVEGDTRVKYSKCVKIHGYIMDKYQRSLPLLHEISTQEMSIMGDMSILFIESGMKK